MSASYCHGCGILKSEGVVHTCGQYAKSSDSVSAEGVVLPERPKHVTRNTEDGPVLYHSYVAAEKHFTLLETKLTEAIAQRDAARNECLELRTQWKERAINAEDDLATSTMRINGDADRIAELEAALAAMTDDRNLWQNAHDEDCPNKAALDTERKDKAQLQYALEQSESKFPAERARALNWLYRMVGEIYGSKRTKQRIQKAILAAQK